MLLLDSVDIDLKQEVTKWQCPHELGGKSGCSLGINKAVKVTPEVRWEGKSEPRFWPR